MRSTLTIALVFLPGSLFADALMDRYQAANDAKATQMEEFYVSRVPELAGVMPEMGWDDEIAAVAACTLDGVRAERGEDGAEAYVAAMEEWATVPVTSMMTLAEGMPAVLSDDLAVRLATECGGMELGMRRMQESGMMAIIQDPEVMQRLIAE
jgi:hypothetical protein